MNWHQLRTRTLKCLYPLDLLHTAAVNSEFYPVSPRVIALRNSAGEFVAAIEEADFSVIVDDIRENLPAHEEFLRVIRRRFSTSRRAFLLAARQLRDAPFERDDTATLFNEFNRRYSLCSSLVWTAIAVYPMAVERVASQEVLRAGFPAEELGGILTGFGASHRPSFSRKAELHLLTVARNFSADPTITKSIETVDQQVVELLKKASPANYKLVADFVERYGWVPYDYTGPAWTIQNICTRIREILAQPTSLAQKHEDVVWHSRALTRERAEIRGRLSRHPSAAVALRLLSSVSFLQDWRKEVFTYAHYCVSSFLDRVGGVLSLDDWTDLRYLTAEELSKVVSGGAPDLGTAQERRRLWSAICSRGRGFTPDSGETARRSALILQDLPSEANGLLTGTPASQGRAVGRVHVLRDETEVGSLEFGEILVTKMTTPAFEVALAKASAVVTDEGGITSHAATRSRERGIPCIVGTQNATRVLRTGDLVEVDATAGLVRKLSATEGSPAIVPDRASAPKTQWTFSDQLPAIRSWVERRRFVVPLSDEDAKRSELVGGKAASSSTLVGKVQMPPGFCVTTAAFARFIEADGIDHKLNDLATSLIEHSILNVDAYSQQATQLIIGGAIPAEIRADVVNVCQGFSEPFAVRSSSTAEDAELSSAAGIFDTFLNVSGEHALFDAVQRCWASLYSARAVAFRRQYAIPETQAMMAVLVQQLINPHLSGTLFTANPSTGSRDEILIEVVEGMGESLVSGQVVPDRYMWSRRFKRIISYEKGYQRVALVASPAGGLTSVPVPIKPTGQRIARDTLDRLVHLGEIVEGYFGFPQDIEWALADDLYLLQSRRITTRLTK